MVYADECRQLRVALPLRGAPTESPSKAKRRLIPSQRDARPNMLRIPDLYAGKANEDAVLRKAADPAAKCFAGLYIGLYWEANGDVSKAKPWLKRANDASRDQDYMGAVARLHWSRLPQVTAGDLR